MLAGDDLAAVRLEGGRRAGTAQSFPLTQKPSEEFLESFYWERVPARGGCGRRG
jgi:hypothetical protein